MLTPFMPAHPFNARLATLLLVWDDDLPKGARRRLARIVRLVTCRPQ